MAESRADEGRRRRWRPFLITLVLVAGAALAVWFFWHQYMHTLWTRDARVRAAVIQVAPDVSGPITGLNVSNNARVAQGDPLFVVDPERYRLALHRPGPNWSTAGWSRNCAATKPPAATAWGGQCPPRSARRPPAWRTWRGPTCRPPRRRCKKPSWTWPAPG